MITRKPTRRTAVAVALIIPLVVTLAACSADSGGDSGTADARTLTIAIGAQPPSFDPAQADLGESAYVWTGIYDTLLTVDADGVVQPRAAESWEYSDDAATLTLNLREDLTFSDGSAVVAEDVAKTIDRSRTTPGPRVPDLHAIESVDAPDEHTVVLNLSEPDPALLGHLAMAGGIIGDPDTLDEDRTALDPIGSGPYVLDKDASTTGATYVLNRRDDYWDVEDYPYSKVTIKVIEDPQAKSNALQAGEIDAGPARLDELPGLESAGMTVKTIDATAWGGLVILDRAGDVFPALGDARVRQAINMTFDRDLYVQQLLGGDGQATEQFYNPIQAGYAPNLNDTYKYDVEAAKELLADAGYPDGFSVTLPSTFLSTSFEPAVTQSLADIGITATWEAVPPQEIVASLSSGKYGMAWYFEGLNSPAIMTLSDLGPSGLLNPTGYTTPELTSLLSEVATTTDTDAQAAVYEEINTYSVENALVVPVFYASANWVLKPGVEYLPNGAVPIYLSNFGAS